MLPCVYFQVDREDHPVFTPSLQLVVLACISQNYTNLDVCKRRKFLYRVRVCLLNFFRVFDKYSLSHLLFGLKISVFKFVHRIKRFFRCVKSILITISVNVRLAVGSPST